MAFIHYLWAVVTCCMYAQFAASLLYHNRTVWEGPSTTTTPKPNVTAAPTVAPGSKPWWAEVDWLKVTGLVTMVLLSAMALLMILNSVYRAYVWVKGVLRRRWARTRQWVTELSPLLQAETSFTMERMVAASPLIATKLVPSFQAEVWTSDGGEFVKSGCGFRCSETQFMTAYHVIAYAKEVRIVTSVGHVDLSVERFAQTRGDIAIAVLDPVSLSRLSLTKPKMSAAAVVRGGGTFGTVVAYGQKSMGMVMPYEAFGYVTYTGSTLHGFSGAPYHLGNTVLGMHIGSQTQNLGYDGSYLAACVASTQESTQWLENMVLRRGRKIKATRSPFDPDEVDVLIDGRYHRIQLDNIPDRVMDQIIWVGLEDVHVERESCEVAEKPKIVYIDSGNGRGPSSSKPNRTAAAQGPGGMSVSKASVAPRNLSKPIEILQFGSVDPQMVTPGLELTHVPPSGPSRSIASAETQQQPQPSNQRRRRSNKPSPTQRASFLSGISDSGLRTAIPSIVRSMGWRWTVSQDTVNLRVLAQQMGLL
uniref:Protease n=1 Tax=Store beach virus TaxID=2485880 RepID=A0A3G3BTD1_9VIRU|nr:protease [Store beach virus]